MSELTEKQIKIIPQTYGEAIQKYPFIDCENYEWDNRTTLENAIYLIELLTVHPLNRK